MAFLSKTDLTTIIYAEDIDAITEGDDSKVDTAINAAVLEAQGYLDLYDTTALFAHTAGDRDAFLVEICKALTMIYLIKAAAPNQNVADLKEGAKEARRNLERIQSGRMKPVGWPLKADPAKSTYFHVSSNPKRGNHY